jgi:hypothetical protein
MMKLLFFIILHIVMHEASFAQKPVISKIVIHFISAANMEDSVICKVTLIHNGNRMESRQDFKYFIKIAPDECISMYCEPQDGVHYPKTVECDQITSRLLFTANTKLLQLVKTRLQRSKTNQTIMQQNPKIGQFKSASVNTIVNTTFFKKKPALVNTIVNSTTVKKL